MSPERQFILLVGCPGAKHPNDESFIVCGKTQGRCLHTPTEFLPEGEMQIELQKAMQEGTVLDLINEWDMLGVAGACLETGAELYLLSTITTPSGK